MCSAEKEPIRLASMAPVLQLDSFLPHLSQFIYIQELSWENQQQQAVLIALAQLYCYIAIIFPLQGWCSSKPFFFSAAYAVLDPTCCSRRKKKKLQANFKCVYHNAPSLVNVHGSKTRGKHSEGELKERQMRIRSVFVFLDQWCMTSLSHSADCLPGLHAFTCDDPSSHT